MHKIIATAPVPASDLAVCIVLTVEGFYFVAGQTADGALVSDEIAYTREVQAREAANREWARLRDAVAA